MKVMFTVLYLTIGINGLSLSMRLCAQDPRSFTMEEVEGIVYTLANEKGVPSTVILNRLLRKARIRQRAEKTRPKDPLQEIALEELINSESLSRSPPISANIGGRRRPDRLPIVTQQIFPPPSNSGIAPLIGGAIYPPHLSPPRLPVESLPTMPRQQSEHVLAGMLLPPGFPPQMARPIPHSLFIPFPSLNPPPGITIRVKAGGSVNTIPEVTVTLSPMMTIVEALKQAESKFRSVLGLSPVSDAEVISFSHSSYAECYVIRSFDRIESSENGYWKIIVSDISGKVIYDSVCLPSRSEVAVKPGMTITLLYTVV